MEKWRMYNRISQLRELGFSKSKIAKKLGIARGTVNKYLDRNPEEMSLWLSSTKNRKRKLDKHQKEILGWLREHPDLSSAQIFDWLDEKYEKFEVGESTVRRYVRQIRKEYNIPKTTKMREYEAIPELPMGFQAQVDFGQCWQLNDQGQTIKLYVVAFVLSHSRYKYMEWLDHPFTTKDLVEAHENAFRAFGGIPKEMVYDQDNIIIVSEIWRYHLYKTI
ncbi:helix-turn-helix domain-containing protein [Alteribacillus sp. JSM 102045]|uniref:helix-turn-helix domain-containing protein n=1 Tax=Alteribacillus sp. JSM 102045 TaxID=1562101 RepID=UPI0035C03965